MFLFKTDLFVSFYVLLCYFLIQIISKVCTLLKKLAYYTYKAFNTERDRSSPIGTASARAIATTRVPLSGTTSSCNPAQYEGSSRFRQLVAVHSREKSLGSKVRRKLQAGYLMNVSVFRNLKLQFEDINLDPGSDKTANIVLGNTIRLLRLMVLNLI